MQDARIAIIGGGLAGLYAAWLLEQQSIDDYILLEARPATGGRIVSISPTQGHDTRDGHPATTAPTAPTADIAAHNSANTTSNPNTNATGNTTASSTATIAATAPAAANTPPCIDRFDLGPSWFWPAFQPELDRVVRELGLERFTQHEAGDMLMERSPHAPPMRMRGYVSAPPSMRLVGGMASLTDALRARLTASRIITGQRVTRLEVVGNTIEVRAEDPLGQSSNYRVQHVLLALPPRLAVDSIEFLPALPAALAENWRNTETWMAPHAKYFAIYDKPFWREQGLSGEARSAAGPLGEIHDATMPNGHAALFGFFAIPARIRQSVSDEALRTHCRAQFVRLFGPQAASPLFDVIKDWSADPCTATSADRESSGQHPMTPDSHVSSGPWQGRLVGIGSEWSPSFSGYVAGAVEAARLGMRAIAHV